MYCLFLSLFFIYWETMKNHSLFTCSTPPLILRSSILSSPWWCLFQAETCSFLRWKLYNNIHACLHTSPTYILSEMRTLTAYQIREVSTALYSSIMFSGLFSLPFLITLKSQFSFLTAARISWCFQRNIHNDFQSTFLGGNS